VLALPSELTHAQARSCLAELDAAVAQHPSPVVVDASALQRFDSSALAVLLAVGRTCQRAGKTLAVQGLPQHMQDLAALYGIAELLPSA
jgi:phospholipid transport system transporter-binding protein